MTHRIMCNRVKHNHVSECLPFANKALIEALTTVICISGGHATLLLGYLLVALWHVAVLPCEHHYLFGLGCGPGFASREGGDDVWSGGGAVAWVCAVTTRAQWAVSGRRRAEAAGRLN